MKQNSIYRIIVNNKDTPLKTNNSYEYTKELKEKIKNCIHKKDSILVSLDYLRFININASYVCNDVLKDIYQLENMLSYIQNKEYHTINFYDYFQKCNDPTMKTILIKFIEETSFCQKGIINKHIINKNLNLLSKKS